MTCTCKQNAQEDEYPTYVDKSTYLSYLGMLAILGGPSMLCTYCCVIIRGRIHVNNDAYLPKYLA